VFSTLSSLCFLRQADSFLLSQRTVVTPPTPDVIFLIARHVSFPSGSIPSFQDRISRRCDVDDLRAIFQVLRAAPFQQEFFVDKGPCGFQGFGPLFLLTQRWRRPPLTTVLLRLTIRPPQIPLPSQSKSNGCSIARVGRAFLPDRENPG